MSPEFNFRLPALVTASVFISIIAGACSSTVDLSEPTIATSVPPTCAISPGDYKLLSYWNKRTDNSKYGRIIADLEKKYRAAPRVGDSSAVVAAQSYVRRYGQVSPLQMEAKIRESCKPSA